MELNIRNILNYTLLLIMVAMFSGSDISIHKTPPPHPTKAQQLKEFITSTPINSIGLPTVLLEESEFNDLLDNNDSKIVFLQASLQKLPTFFLRLASSINLSVSDSPYSINYIPLYILFHSMRIPYSTN